MHNQEAKEDLREPEELLGGPVEYRTYTRDLFWVEWLRNNLQELDAVLPVVTVTYPNEAVQRLSLEQLLATEDGSANTTARPTIRTSKVDDSRGAQLYSYTAEDGFGLSSFLREQMRQQQQQQPQQQQASSYEIIRNRVVLHNSETAATAASAPTSAYKRVSLLEASRFIPALFLSLSLQEKMQVVQALAQRNKAAAKSVFIKRVNTLGLEALYKGMLNQSGKMKQCIASQWNTCLVDEHSHGKSR